MRCSISSRSAEPDGSIYRDQKACRGIENDVLESLDIFFGEASNAAARVYARLPADGLPNECTLTGRVVGPSCEYSRTLSATVPFTSKSSARISGDSEMLLAEAIVPDPCFWSQELPFLYRAEIELRCGSEVLETAERPFGIRPLGAGGRQLIWEGRPWVLRAVDLRELPEQPLPNWRAADLAMLIENPSDEICRDASRLGVVLIADLTAARDDLMGALRRFACWPAVAVAMLDSLQSLPANARDAAKNLLLAENHGPGVDQIVSPWVDLVFCEGKVDHIVSRTAGLSMPVVIQRPAGWCDALAGARRHCDRLQRDLAGRGDFAGYIV
jgi:hypothetical protein